MLTPADEKLNIVLKGDLAAMLAAASPKAEDLRRQVTLVAGGRVRRWQQVHARACAWVRLETRMADVIRDARCYRAVRGQSSSGRSSQR